VGAPTRHAPTRPDEAYDRVSALLGHRFRLDSLVAMSPERVLFLAWDLVLKRRVALRANFSADDSSRAWFLRESEALAQLDHPAIRHVYELGVIGEMAYRTGNWVEGEGLDTAVSRGPRPIPTVHALVRDLLGALEHAHARGMVVRRIVPASVVVNLAGRGTITDLRYASLALPVIPRGEVPLGLEFMAPEVRQGQVGDQASDVFTAGAILYFAVTGVEPPLELAALRPPSALRPTCPQTIERVLLRALSANPGDRYLTAAEMYEDFASDAGTFETPAVSPSDTGVTRALTEDTGLWEKRLRRALGDDYELLDALGSGGFGRVYRVRDLHLEREVALKVLHPMFTADPAVVERFRREAQLAARLNHPNIVNIYDIAGRSGLLWYTMELVNGPSLAGVVEREGPLPVDRVVRLLREALSALAHAYASGLVHRDLKPENLLIEPDGSVRITDFGLALALRGVAGRFGGATSQSGTPQFASPEQLLGERVDQRSDLYSLAAVAVYALLGRPPFPGLTPEQVLARQTTNQLPSLRDARPDLPEELAEVLERALQAEVELRFPSAAEFLQALHRAVGKNLRRGQSGEWDRVSGSWWRGGAPGP
jgi:serine/threonine-protein kinase